LIIISILLVGDGSQTQGYRKSLYVADGMGDKFDEALFFGCNKNCTCSVLSSFVICYTVLCIVLYIVIIMGNNKVTLFAEQLSLPSHNLEG
jgi:hypothetical protein